MSFLFAVGKFFNFSRKFLKEWFRAEIRDSVYGIKAQCIYVITSEPVESAFNKEVPDFIAVCIIKIQGHPP